MSIASFSQIVSHGGRLIINGKTYNSMPQFQNISIVDGVIVADGKVWSGENEKNAPNAKDLSIANKIELHVHLDGNVKSKCTIQADHGAAVIVHGSVSGDVRTVAGSIQVDGNVEQGDVSSTNGGIVIRGTVGGNVSTTNGSIRTGAVRGRVSSVNGSIVHQ